MYVFVYIYIYIYIYISMYVCMYVCIYIRMPTGIQAFHSWWHIPQLQNSINMCYYIWARIGTWTQTYQHINTNISSHEHKHINTSTQTYHHTNINIHINIINTNISSHIITWTQTYQLMNTNTPPMSTNIGLTWKTCRFCWNKCEETNAVPPVCV